MRRFLTTNAVMEKLGIRSRTTLLKLRRSDKRFPAPRLRGGEILVWFEDEIDAWMLDQPIAS